ILDIGGDPARLIPREALEFRSDMQGPRGEQQSKPLDGAELTREASRVRSALGALGPGVNDEFGREFVSTYDLWLKFGMALHVLGDAGFELWVEWSSKCREKFSREACAAKWETFSDDGTRPVTLASIFHYAIKAGWRDPWVRA